MEKLFYEREEMLKVIPEIKESLEHFFEYSPKQTYVVNKIPLEEIIKYVYLNIIGPERPKIIEDYLSYKSRYLSLTDKKNEILNNHQEMSVEKQLKLMGVSHSTYYYQPRRKTRKWLAKSVGDNVDIDLLMGVLEVLYSLASMGITVGYYELIETINGNGSLDACVEYNFKDYRKQISKNKITRKILMYYMQMIGYATPYPYNKERLRIKHRTSHFDEGRGFQSYFTESRYTVYVEQDSLGFGEAWKLHKLYCPKRGKTLIYHYWQELLELRGSVTDDEYYAYINDKNIQPIRKQVEMLYKRKKADDLKYSGNILILSVVYYPRKDRKNCYLFVVQKYENYQVVYYDFIDNQDPDLYIESIKRYLEKEDKPAVIHLEKKIAVYNESMKNFLINNNITVSSDVDKSPISRTTVSGVISIVKYMMQKDLIDTPQNHEIFKKLIKEYNEDCLSGKYPYRDGLGEEFWDWSIYCLKKT